jgi:hypothetical protein
MRRRSRTQARLVGGSRYSRKNWILLRLALGVVKSLEVEDASPTSAALFTLQRWMEKVVEKEVARITAKCERYQERQGYVRGRFVTRANTVEAVHRGSPVVMRCPLTAITVGRHVVR